MSGLGARFRGWLGRHPILFVAMLSPGIVEYLSGSSDLSGLVVSPALFFFLLAANLGLYVPGVLLIREAKVRWTGGWGTVFLLGTAYAFVEEGLALSTMFDPRSGVVGALGVYGHLDGVNWAWIPGVIAIHVMVSISLPILLLDLALPATRGRSLLSTRGIATALVILGTTTAALMAVVAFTSHFFMGVPILLGTLGVIAVLVVAAYRLPANAVRPAGASPTWRPRQFAVLGFLVWPSLLVLEGLLVAARVPPYGMVLAFAGLMATYTMVLVAEIGRAGNEAHRVALGTGLVAPLMIAGAVSQIAVPVVLVADAAAIWFFASLWSRYALPAPTAAPRAVPTAL